MARKIGYGIALTFMLVVICWMYMLPSKTSEYKIESVQFLNKNGLPVSEVIPTKIDCWIRINDDKIVMRNTHEKFEEYKIDSITSYKDVKRIMWSRGTIIILMEEMNTILIEMNQIIEKYDVRKNY